MLDRRDEPPAVSTEGLDPSAASPAKPVRPNEEARASLARWLSTRRLERNMTLDDVARITKIQPRILERLESGQFDGLPADVFVRGFVRSFAKSIGLDEDEALKRYAACGQHAPAPVAAAARAMVDAMIDLAPLTARSGVRSTQELPVVAPPVETIETVMLPETGTLVVEKPVEPVAPVSEPVAEPAPAIAEAVVEAAEAAETVETKPSKKKRRGGKRRNKRADMAIGTPAQASPVVAEASIDVTDASSGSLMTETDTSAAHASTTADAATTVDAATTADASATDASATNASTTNASTTNASTTNASTMDASETADASPTDASPSDASLSIPGATAVEVADAQPVSVDDIDEPVVTQPWRPKMPPLASAAVPPWKISRPSSAQGPVLPSLVIDDADPDSAERERDERAAQREGKEPRRSFLPPILLDREDRSARQGGLTLAVIILLIAATITLSYLMRRPSSSGDGVTLAAPPATLIG